MTSLSRALRLALAASVLLAAPGPQAWAAAGKGTTSPAPAPRTPGGRVRIDNPIAGLKVPLAPGAPGVMRLPDIDPALLKPGAMPGSAIVVPQTAPAAAEAKKAVPTALKRLQGAQGEMARAREGNGVQGEKDAQDGLYGEGRRQDGEIFVDAPMPGVTVVNFARAARGSKNSSTPIPDEPQRPPNPDDDLDDLGNPRRDPGRDDGPDGTGGGNGGPFLGFRASGEQPSGDGSRGQDLLFAATMVAAAAFTAGTERTLESALLVPLIVGSLVLHEMAHAAVAYLFGDTKPVMDNRASFKPRDLATHIDLWGTVVYPLFSFLTTGMVIGWANPVDTGKNKGRLGEFLTATAGPVTHLALAGIGAAAFAAVGGAAAGFIGTALGLFTIVNTGLFLFNLVPLYPLDGHHLLHAVLPQKWAQGLEEWYESSQRAPGEGLRSWIKRFGFMPYAPLAAFLGIMIATGALTQPVFWLAGLLLGGTGAIGTVQVASAFLPAVAALGMMAGTVKGPPTLNPGNPVPVESLSGQEPVEFIVSMDGKPSSITQNAHVDWVDSKGMFYARRYAKVQEGLLAQVKAAGLDAEELAKTYKAAPRGSFQLINSVSFRVAPETAAAFKLRLEADGHSVWVNSRDRFKTPPDQTPLHPEADPGLAKPVTIEANLKAINAVPLMERMEKAWGKPGATGVTAWLGRLFTAQAPQPPVAGIDTGMRVDHKLLLGVNAPKNATNGPGEDDNGHGTWISGMIRAVARWLRNFTHYKAFVGGSASDEDILKAMTMSFDDGNIIFSNSWGDDTGDPNSPTSKMAYEMAKKGRIVIFAAGNNGYSGMNTIGEPAIIYYQDPDTGAVMTLAVAAASVDGKIVAFSSKGLKSQKTKDDPNQQPRPDVSAPGYNTEGAWLKTGYDRLDAILGELKAISGTSMATPGVAGALALLAMAFGVVKSGRELNLIVKALVETAVKKDGRGPAYEGNGFIDVEAAFQKALEWGLKPALPNFVQRSVLSVMRFIAPPADPRRAGARPETP